jgi:hypothetical protein
MDKQERKTLKVAGVLETDWSWKAYLMESTTIFEETLR